MDNVPQLRGIVLPILSTVHLLFLLNTWPGLGDTPLIMELLCSRDIRAAIEYLLSLSYSHRHRQAMKHHLRKRLRWVPVHELRVSRLVSTLNCSGGG